MGWSDGYGNAILNAILRGQALTLPTQLWLGLHTDAAGGTGANEATTVAWPAYARQSLLGGGAIADAFSEATDRETFNGHQMLYPAFDGAGTIVLTHWGIWTAANAGSLVLGGQLLVDPTDPESAADPKTLRPGDEFVIYANKLGIFI